MKAEHYRDDQLTAYLLGALPPRDVEHFDELSITDDEFALRLQMLENDLVDAYVRGELAPSTLQRFESYYLISPLRREKVDFARRFTSAADSRAHAAPARTPRTWLRLFPLGHGWHSVYPVAACLLAIVGIWFAVQTSRLRHERDLVSEQYRNAERRAQSLQQALDAQAPNAPQTATQSVMILAFNLLPQTRGAMNLPVIVLPADAAYANAQAELESSGYAAYKAELFTLPARQSVWTAAGLLVQRAAERRYVKAAIPANVLGTGSYLLQVSGERRERKADIVGTYAFRIIRE